MKVTVESQCYLNSLYFATNIVCNERKACEQQCWIFLALWQLVWSTQLIRMHWRQWQCSWSFLTQQQRSRYANCSYKGRIYL